MRTGVSQDSRRLAFTLVELLLAVSIMTIIIIGLYAIFDQTQRALRGAMAQTDTMESARALDIVTRDLEGAAFANIPGYTNFYVTRNPISEGADINGLDGRARLLHSSLQDIFFHTRVNDSWTALGFWVGASGTNARPPIFMGRLYRFSTNVTTDQMRTWAGAADYADRNTILNTFNSNARLRHSQPVIDGVVHLRLRAYAADGSPLVWTNQPAVLAFQGQTDPNDKRPLSFFPDPLNDRRPENAGNNRYGFMVDSYPPAPAYLELELGIVEPETAARVASIPVPSEARKFLARNARKVHLFRQRIRIGSTLPY